MPIIFIIKGERMIIPQIVKYILVGAIATAVDMGLFWLLIEYGSMHYSYALFIGFIVGAFINFYLCNLFIFNRGEQSFWHACLKQYGASATGLFLNQLGLFIAVSWFNCHRLLLARIIITACTFMINFLLVKYFVFARPSST
jgi:putative flippase GtrA